MGVTGVRCIFLVTVGIPGLVPVCHKCSGFVGAFLGSFWHVREPWVFPDSLLSPVAGGGPATPWGSPLPLSQGREGEIRHLFRGFAFLHCKKLVENGGMFVCKTRHLVLAGGSKVGARRGSLLAAGGCRDPVPLLLLLSSTVSFPFRSRGTSPTSLWAALLP